MGGPQKIEYASDFLLAWRAIANGVTTQSAKTRQKYWQHWVSYTYNLRTDPYLKRESKLNQSIILTGYATQVRAGTYGLGNEVKVQTVSNALAAISKTIELAGECSPVYQDHEKYILPIQRCLEGFRRDDPPAIAQLAVPVAVPNKALALAYATSCPLQQAAGDLIIIAFYFLLRSGEYTKPKRIKENGQWSAE